MPLYDNNNALGWEAPTLVAIADWLSESAGAQSLVEATGTTEEKKAKTLAKVVIGPQKEPDDGDKFTIPELANRFVEFQVFSPTEAEKAGITDGTSTVSVVGEFGLYTRMYCREAALVDRQDLYLFFIDRVSEIEQHLAGWFAAGRNEPRIKLVIRQNISFGSWKSSVSQGEFLQAAHRIPWGDFTDD